MEKLQYQQIKKYVQKLESQNQELRDKLERVSKFADTVIFDFNSKITGIDRLTKYMLDQELINKRIMEMINEDVYLQDMLSKNLTSLSFIYSVIEKNAIEYSKKKSLIEDLIKFLDYFCDKVEEYRNDFEKIETKNYNGVVPVDEEFAVKPEANFKRWW